MEQIKKLIRRDWPYFIAITLFFILMVVGGYYLQGSNPQITRAFQKLFFERLKQIALLMKGQPVWIQIGIIWFNNLIASVTAICLGVFLGIFPLLSLMGNGLAIGIMQQLVEQNGLAARQFYLGLFLHGVFELPAFFIAVGLGLRFGTIPFCLIWQHHMSEQRRPLLRLFFLEARYYLALITILLFVAAIIEITVSPILLQ
ncbi:MAG: stage II sporulation protein M [Bacillota bacterium]|jgi:stage II sporulation protein M